MELALWSPDDVMHKYGDWAAVAYFLGIAIFGGLLLLLVMVVLGRSTHRRRRRRREAWGRKHGLVLIDQDKNSRGLMKTESDAGSQTLSNYPYVSLFQFAGASAMHILEGTIDDLPARVFEWHYFTGSGKYTQEHHYTTIAFEYDANKGHTAFRRRGFLDGLPKDDIVTGHPALDKAFYVYADAWGLLQNELPNDLETTITQGLTHDFSLAGPHLVLTAKGRLKDKRYDQFLAEARQLAAWIATKR